MRNSLILLIFILSCTASSFALGQEGGSSSALQIEIQSPSAEFSPAFATKEAATTGS